MAKKPYSNKGLVFEKEMFKKVGQEWSFQGNVAHVDMPDLIIPNSKGTGLKVDLKTGRGSVMTTYGDSRKWKELQKSERESFIKSNLKEYLKGISDRRKFYFSIDGSLDEIFVMNKSQWSLMLHEFCTGTESTDKGNYLKTKLDIRDAKVARFYAWANEQGIKTIAL